MNQAKLLIKTIKSNHALRDTSFDVDPAPLDYFDPNDSIEFHASRLLLLLAFCSSDKTQNGRVGIKGRTKLAKLDFFLRYPLYLEKVLAKSNSSQTKLSFHIDENEKFSIEAKMIRYKYGPWDQKYFDIFAYLLGKGLMEIVPSGGVDYFILSESGQQVAVKLAEKETFQSLVSRCHIIKKILGGYSGASLKNMIYENFPEIVRKPLGSLIRGIYYE